ncbi:MAG: nitroreductase [Salinarimonadaceae bacterium]|nr:MAG: nitroreductase [Salinarimonadaceae bacterium]
MQQQTLDLLSARRSVAAKMLREPGPGREELERMLSVAARVPDHGKLEPWRFVVVAAEARERIGEVIAAAAVADDPQIDEEKLAQQRGLLARAPVVVAVVSRAAPHPKIPEWEQILSAGAACQNLLIAVRASGYAANWITEWIAYDRRVLDALGLTAGERIAGFVHIGSADFTPPDRARPALDTIVTWL